MCPLPAIGSSCPDSGMSQPLPCPPGWSSTPGQTYCRSCNDTSLLCGGVVAPRWSQPLHRSSQTISCRPGTYKESGEELACVVCPVGQCLSLRTTIYITVSFLSWQKPNMYLYTFLFAPGHYCVGGVVVPCPAGTFGPKEGLQRLRDCTICPAGTVLIVVIYILQSIFCYTHSITSKD